MSVQIVNVNSILDEHKLENVDIGVNNDKERILQQHGFKSVANCLWAKTTYPE